MNSRAYLCNDLNTKYLCNPGQKLAGYFETPVKVNGSHKSLKGVSLGIRHAPAT